jgi:hypothetical protein
MQLWRQGYSVGCGKGWHEVAKLETIEGKYLRRPACVEIVPAESPVASVPFRYDLEKSSGLVLLSSPRLTEAGRVEMEGIMGIDTKKLVVGQEVYMVCGEIYSPSKGKVAKVTPDGVEVQCGNERLRFDNDGNELDESRRERLGFGPSPESKFHTILWQCAPEFQPYHLDDIPEPAAREREERTRS